MTFRLPDALRTSDDDVAIGLLKRYFGTPYLSPGCADGAFFDTWTSSDPFRFTADDLIAIKFLSVEAPKTAVRQLLRDRADEFAKMLVDLGPDRDLADEPQPLDDEWPGWTLMRELRGIHRVGKTKASKLLARKRPRLRPIWDQSSRKSPAPQTFSGNHCGRHSVLTITLCSSGSYAFAHSPSCPTP